MVKCQQRLHFLLFHIGLGPVYRRKTNLLSDKQNMGW